MKFKQHEQKKKMEEVRKRRANPPPPIQLPIWDGRAEDLAAKLLPGTKRENVTKAIRTMATMIAEARTTGRVVKVTEEILIEAVKVYLTTGH